MSSFRNWGFVVAAVMSVLFVRVPVARAHCDTLGGPVVADARVALEQGDVTPALKWVMAENEAEVRAAFSRTLAVRGKGEEAKALADLYFYETLVRLHRAGEGAPYTGLKPADADAGPAVRMADEALSSASADSLAQKMAEEVSEGVRSRWAKAVAAKKHAEHDVESGRQFVRAYVEFVHYVERLHNIATADAAEGHEEAHGEHGHE